MAREREQILRLKDSSVLIDEEFESVIERRINLDDAVCLELDCPATKTIGVDDRGEAWTVYELFTVLDHSALKLVKDEHLLGKIILDYES